MTKRRTKLPARYREGFITPALPTRQSSHPPSIARPRQRDARGRYGSTFSPEPIRIPLNDTSDGILRTDGQQYRLTEETSTEVPASHRTTTPKPRPATTKKRKKKVSHTDDDYMTIARRGHARKPRVKPAQDARTEVEEVELDSEDSLEAYLHQSSESEGHHDQKSQGEENSVPNVAVGTTAELGVGGAIQLDAYWSQNEEVPPIPAGLAQKLKPWELRQYIRRSDKTLAKVRKLLRDTDWLDNTQTTKRGEYQNFGRNQTNSTEEPLHPENQLTPIISFAASVTSTPEDTYLTPRALKIACASSPTIAGLRASGGGLLSKADLSSTSSSAIRWVMQPRSTPTLSISPSPVPSPITSCATSRGHPPLPSPSFRLKVDSHYHASVGTATPPDPPSPIQSHPRAVRSGNDYSQPRGFPHTPPRAYLELDLPTQADFTGHIITGTRGRKSGNDCKRASSRRADRRRKDVEKTTF